MNESNSFTIGEASERTGLPESTIRYYDREFSDYLSIERGQNNQRLFTEENLKDLEYIRYLLKREDFTVQQVKDKLGTEEELRRREELIVESSGSSSAGEEEMSPETPVEPQPAAGEPGEEIEKLASEIESVHNRLDKIEGRLESLENLNAEIRRLLDMNLERYNKLVDEIF